MDIANTYRPVSTEEYYAELANGENRIGTELIAVVGEDLLNVLKVQRDPWLWCSVMFGLNYDLETSGDTAAWILDQDDCDALIAVAAFGAMSGPDVFVRGWDREKPLRVLIERAESRPFAQSQMRAADVPFVDGAGLITMCQNLFEKLRDKGDQAQLISEPLKELLRTPLNGAIPRIEYMVGEEGLWMVPVQLGHSIN